ncbi:MAG: hypothetical protein K1000chlam1_01370 [Candidatus Anoxychlamydiales bacterium]|nr:hypothetical protein [Candidatus Anoxychlamydiales bacterium]
MNLLLKHIKQKLTARLKNYFLNMVCIMKINKVYTLFILILLLLSCSQKTPKSIQKKDYFTKGKLFIKKIVPKIKKQNNFFLNAHGINIDNTINSPDWHSIHDLYFTFYSLRKVNIQEARKAFIDCIETILNEINNDKEISNYLYVSPFSYKNLDLSIVFFDKTGSPRPKKYIYSCTLDGDIIHYEIANPDGTFAYIHKETYDEALKIVKSEK